MIPIRVKDQETYDPRALAALDRLHDSIQRALRRAYKDLRELSAEDSTLVLPPLPHRHNGQISEPR